jgi:hypothetical protein
VFLDDLEESLAEEVAAGSLKVGLEEKHILLLTESAQPSHAQPALPHLFSIPHCLGHPTQHRKIFSGNPSF